MIKAKAEGQEQRNLIGDCWLLREKCAANSGVVTDSFAGVTSGFVLSHFMD